MYITLCSIYIYFISSLWIVPSVFRLMKYCFMVFQMLLGIMKWQWMCVSLWVCACESVGVGGGTATAGFSPNTALTYVFSSVCSVCVYVSLDLVHLLILPAHLYYGNNLQWSLFKLECLYDLSTAIKSKMSFEWLSKATQGQHHFNIFQCIISK